MRDVKYRREVNTRTDVKERVGDCMSCAYLPQERDSSSCCCRGDGTSDCVTGVDFWGTCGTGSCGTGTCGTGSWSVIRSVCDVM